MKTKTLLIVVTSILFLSAAKERTYMGYQVVDKEFPIAGGKTVRLPVTEAGPIPAENQDFKIEAAGVSVQPSPLNPKQAALAWGFALTDKSSKALERVVVEEVYPSSTATAMVEDYSPYLKEKVWSGNSAGVEPNPIRTPWLFDDRGSVFVFRFTITPAGSPPVVLYQPTWYSQSIKAQFRQVVVTIKGK